MAVKKKKKTKKTSQQASLVDKIKDYLSFGEYIIPTTAKKQAYEFYALGGILAVIGVVVSIVTQDLLSILFALVLGLVLAARGYYVMLDVSKNGYELIQGKCIGIDYGRIPLPKKKPSKFLIQEEERSDGEEPKIYAILYFKQNQFIAEDAEVSIYVPTKATIYERNGVYNISNTLGYEITGYAHDEHEEKES